MHPQNLNPNRLPISRRRSAFTLLELMLVLTILVLIGAIAAPRLTDVFERQKLNGSASNIRLSWDKARLEAMRTGQSQVFECVLGSGEFSIKPLLLGEDISNAAGGATVMTNVGTLVETQDNGFATAADPTEMTETETIEDGINFLNCQVASDLRAYAVAQQSQTTGASQVTTQNLSQRVIFYPDGSTSTAEVQLQNSRGDVRAVRIRGLTGHSRIVALLNVASGAEKDESK
ncbi:MAG: Tfp pilus assembly protein FimT/FimU [Pirellulaceae bacterium]